MGFMNVQQMAAQAPNCEECDEFIDDPAAYAECIEENCGTGIPIDNGIWLLLVGGIGLGAYAMYKYPNYIANTYEA